MKLANIGVTPLTTHEMETALSTEATIHGINQIEIGVPAQGISEIISGKRSITADTDLRLCKFFGLSNGYWLRAQVAHDTEVAERRTGDLLSKIRPYTDVPTQSG